MIILVLVQVQEFILIWGTHVINEINLNNILYNTLISNSMDILMVIYL